MDEITFNGIGTKWWIKIYDEVSKEAYKSVSKEISDYVQIFEKNFSRFKEESFVGKLNKYKSIENYPRELFEMIQYCNNVQSLTQNHFSLFVGTFLERLGYDKDLSFEKHNSENNPDIAQGFIELTENKISIRDVLTVDLGGIGKGWLIDKIKEILINHNIKYFYINGGGDIYASSNYEKPINFKLENPFVENEFIGEINIFNSSICASGINKRKWVDNAGNIYHHLINLESFEPVKNIAAIFTWGNTALEADTSSTCLFVTPVNLYNSIKDYFEIEFIIVYEDGSFSKTKNYPGILN